MLDIRKAIEAKCKDFAKGAEKWDGVDPEGFRKSGDMNRYIAYLNKRHWAIPFILGDFPSAKKALATQIRYQAEFDKFLQHKGQWGEFEERAKWSCSWITVDLTFEDMCKTESLIAGFEERMQAVASVSNELARTAAFGILERTELLAWQYERYPAHYRPRADEIGVSADVVESTMRILLAEHQFWTGDMVGLNESRATLMQTVKKIPKRYFYTTSTEHPVWLWFSKDYYIGFAWFCEFLFGNPAMNDKLERAAAMMLYEALDGHTTDASILAVKYYDIIAQMISRKRRDLEELYRHFPALSALIKKFIIRLTTAMDELRNSDL